MNFDFNDDQKFLKEEARRFLDARVPLTLVHKILDEPAAGHGEALWREVAEQGWLGIAIPEAYGGLGASTIDLCAIAEEIGRAIAPIPFSSSIYLFAQAILLAGSDQQKKEFLTQAASGEIRGCVAVTDCNGAAVVAAQDHLTGEKLPIIDGLDSNYAIVLAKSEDGPSLYIVDLSETVREDVETIDPTRPIARIRFDGTLAARLGAAGEGHSILKRLYDLAAVPMAFEQLGGADRCLEIARDFSLERRAFGRQIGSFQAIKHKLADIFVQNQLARSNCYYGAWAMEANAPELPAAAAAARLLSGEAFWLAAKEGLHVHGGMGFTWESNCQLFYRRSQHLSLALGSAKVWKEQLVGEVLRLRAA